MYKARDGGAWKVIQRANHHEDEVRPSVYSLQQLAKELVSVYFITYLETALSSNTFCVLGLTVMTLGKLFLLRATV